MGTARPEDALLLEVGLSLDEDWADKVAAQQKTYEAIQQFGRKQLKKELEAIHQMLFTQRKHIRFRQKINRLFGKP